MNVSALGVTWKANKKAWVTSALFEEWLKKLDDDMRRHNRQILLFLDKAPCHPDLTDALTNIVLKFFPPNTTSCLQPLDHGIIKNVKVGYHKRLLQHVLSHVDGCEAASDVARSVNVLNVVTWVAQAWGETKPEVIRNCFKHAGFASTGTSDSATSAPPVSAQAIEELQTLVTQVASSGSAENFSSFDDAVLPFATLSENWEEELVQQVLGAGSNAARLSGGGC